MEQRQLKWVGFAIGAVAFLGILSALIARQDVRPSTPNSETSFPPTPDGLSLTPSGQNPLPQVATAERESSRAAKDTQARSTMSLPTTPNNDIESMLAAHPGLSEQAKQMAREAMGKLQRREVQDVPIGPGLEQMLIRVQGSMIPTNEYVSKMASRPTDIGSTRLAKAQDLGAMPEGGSTPEGWSGASRTFRDQDLGLVILEENDLRISRGGLVLAREAVNETINGVPAVISFERDPKTGTTRTNLAWSTVERSFSLTMEPIDAASTAMLIDIAKGLRP
jgi:hypothetical protein